MKINEIILRKGFVTQDKYLLGQTLLELEKRLGYKAGRLSKGIWIAVCLKVPEASQFELKGYSQVAGHKPMNLQSFDIDKLKNMASSAMKTEGPDRLVKVFPVMNHDTNLTDDQQYPPGLGIPQWQLTTVLPFRVTAFVSNYPLERYKII